LGGAAYGFLGGMEGFPYMEKPAETWIPHPSDNARITFPGFFVLYQVTFQASFGLFQITFLPPIFKPHIPSHPETAAAGLHTPY